MSRRHTFYVVKIDRQYVHRGWIRERDVLFLTPDLNEAFEFKSQGDASAAAERIYSLDQRRYVAAIRVSLERVASHRPRRKE